MNVIETGLPGLLIVEPSVFSDARGYFFESFHQQRYFDAGINATFVQDNESKSVRGVVRGLHYQIAEFAQAVSKLSRIVNISDLELSSPKVEGDVAILKIKCKVTTFRFVDNKG